MSTEGALHVPSPGAVLKLIAEHLTLFDDTPNESKQVFTQGIRRSIGIAVHRGWAKLLLDRFCELVLDPRQPRTYTRGADEDDAETIGASISTKAVAGGGHYRTR